METTSTSLPSTPETARAVRAPLPPSKSDDSLVEDHLSSPGQIPDHPDPDTSRLIDEVGSLTSTDVRSDPILSNLARKQAQTPNSSRQGQQPSFKAKPAPSTMRQEGVGPKMTKAAALRQGLKWEGRETNAVKDSTTVKSSKTVSSGEEGRERRAVDFANTPGHKREGLNIAVASLSNPTIAPRETKASMLRNGGMVAAEEKRDMAAQAEANKARDREERLRKRASIALPASLAAPQIAPRANRSSQLRSGGPQAPPTAFARPTTALTATKSATNIKQGKNDESARVKAPYEEKVNRRATMSGVKSLGAPTIAPRANRSSMLRAPGSSTSIPTSSTSTTSGPNPTPVSAAAARSARPSTSAGSAAPGLRSLSSTKSVGKSGRPSTSAGAGSDAVGPKPTKASLLRAGLGAAKVPFK